MLLTLLLGLSGLASGQQVREIIVAGAGQAQAPADWVEVRGAIKRDSSLSGKAIRGYGKFRRRVLAKLKAAEILNLSVKAKGAKFSFSDSMAHGNVLILAVGGGAEAPESEPRIKIAEIVVLRREGLADLSASERRSAIGKMVDAGRNSGLKFRDKTSYGFGNVIAAGGLVMNGAAIQFDGARTPRRVNNAVVFGVNDGRELQFQALQAAIAEAKRRAVQIAARSGVTLGRLLSLSVTQGELIGDSNCLRVEHRVKVKAHYAIR